MGLAQETLNIDHDLLILASSIQVIPTEHRFESGLTSLPKRQTNKLLANHSVPRHYFRDRHRGGIYQYKKPEVTSSSLNRNSSQNVETDTLLLGQTYTQNNFGF